jgi:hypothetical protein
MNTILRVLENGKLVASARCRVHLAFAVAPVDLSGALREESPWTASVWNNVAKVMEEITLQVQRDEVSGWLVAWWDDPDGVGGITTQGQDLRDLQQQITDAVAVHFEEGAVPRRIRIHFVSDPILVQA